MWVSNVISYLCLLLSCKTSDDTQLSWLRLISNSAELFHADIGTHSQIKWRLKAFSLFLRLFFFSFWFGAWDGKFNQYSGHHKVALQRKGFRVLSMDVSRILAPVRLPQWLCRKIRKGRGGRLQKRTVSGAWVTTYCLQIWKQMRSNQKAWVCNSTIYLSIHMFVWGSNLFLIFNTNVFMYSTSWWDSKSSPIFNTTSCQGNGR